MALTDLKVKGDKPKEKAYKLSDGDGMYLFITAKGAKSWRLKYRFDGKEKTLTLGLYPAVSLGDARKRRDEAKVLLSEGVDPSENKKEVKRELENRKDFETVAKEWHANNKTWSNYHRERVLRTLELYMFPLIGDKYIGDLKNKDLLEPIKLVEKDEKLEVAARLQQRITSIMRYAVQSDLIDYNPAQEMAGAIAVVKRKHRPALPLERIPELLSKIDAYHGRPLTKLALKLSLLIFIRSSELRFVRWDEIDFEKKIWTIPAQREEIEGIKFSYRCSKMKTEHLVPLSEQSLAILKEVKKISGDKRFVFVNDHSGNKAMSEGTINKALQSMGYDTKEDICGHGFRAMACSSLIESGAWSRDAVERQMSHQERNGVRAAYIHKAEHLDERRLMVQWWADYLDRCKAGYITPYEFAKSA